jgi:hypothetical protein
MKFAMHRIAIVLIIANAFFSCKPQTNEEKVVVTAKEAIRSIYENDFDSFRRRIGLSRLGIIGKDDESLKADFDFLSSVFSKDSIEFYYNQINVPYSINELGQKNVTIRIPLSIIEAPNFTEALLTLSFGPPQIIPLSKLSGYEIVYLKR